MCAKPGAKSPTGFKEAQRLAGYTDQPKKGLPLCLALARVQWQEFVAMVPLGEKRLLEKAPQSSTKSKSKSPTLVGSIKIALGAEPQNFIEGAKPTTFVSHSFPCHNLSALQVWTHYPALTILYSLYTLYTAGVDALSTHAGGAAA